MLKDETRRYYFLTTSHFGRFPQISLNFQILKLQILIYRNSQMAKWFVLHIKQNPSTFKQCFISNGFKTTAKISFYLYFQHRLLYNFYIQKKSNTFFCKYLYSNQKNIMLMQGQNPLCLFYFLQVLMFFCNCLKVKTPKDFLNFYVHNCP